VAEVHRRQVSDSFIRLAQSAGQFSLFDACPLLAARSLELDSGVELEALRVLQLLLLGAAGLIMMTDWQAYVDIAAEIQRMASEGVAIIAGAEFLQVQLAHTSNTLAFMPTVHLPGDGLELRAALALQEVDDLLLLSQTAQAAPALPPAAVMQQLKALQRHAQDVVVLVHSRYINQNILQCRGIPTELLRCLEATYGTGLFKDDSLWSRLGNSKYHIFGNGVRDRGRKHRHRGSSGHRRAAAVAADAAVELELVGTASHPACLGQPGTQVVVGNSRYEPIASFGAEHTDGSWCTMPPSDTLREASGIESQRSITISKSFLKYIGGSVTISLTGDTTEPVHVDHRSCVSFGSGMSTSTLQSDSEATNDETGGWRLLHLLGPVVSV